MDKENKRQIMSKMLKTGIIEWPKVTYAIVTIKDRDGRVIYHEYFDSIDHQRTEMKLLSDQDFLHRVKTGGVDITITSNYSPWWECAPNLIKFYNNNKHLMQKFTIQFSHLYRINNEKNVAGLQNLSKAGITLEAMTEKSWFDVVIRFMFDLEPALVKIRDEETRKKLEGLLNDDPKPYSVLLCTVEEKQDVLSRMLLPDLERPNDKSIIFTCRRLLGSVNKCYDNSDHEHTVMKMLNDPEVGKVGPPRTTLTSFRDVITLTFNYLPCWKCAADLIKFYKHNDGLINKFTIQFSCLFRTCETNEKTTEKAYIPKKLKEARITLEAMTEKSWFDVLMRLLFGLEPDKVRERDEETSKQLKRLLKDDSVADVTRKFKELEA